MQNAKRKTQNECVAFGDYFNHFPKENTFTLHFAFEQLLDKPEFDGKLWILSGVYMDILEQIRAWLEIRGYLPGIDSCGLAPGETGLFPLGMEQRSLREDVLGNRVRKMRYSFLLRITAVPGETAARNCLQLQMDAQNFPEPGITLRAEKGRLVKKTSTGLGIYELRLTAEREERL